MTDPQKTGVLLFAHGARDPNWARPFEQARDRLASRQPDTPVCLSFLEFMSPDLINAGQHPAVDWQLAPAVGETDILVNALAHAAEHLAGLSQP
jgi:sirohydrochlorin cobaltochelatase